MRERERERERELDQYYQKRENQGWGLQMNHSSTRCKLKHDCTETDTTKLEDCSIIKKNHH